MTSYSLQREINVPLLYTCTWSTGELWRQRTPPYRPPLVYAAQDKAVRSLDPHARHDSSAPAKKHPGRCHRIPFYLTAMSPDFGEPVVEIKSSGQPTLFSQASYFRRSRTATRSSTRR